jgi:hypothetical protein
VNEFAAHERVEQVFNRPLLALAPDADAPRVGVVHVAHEHSPVAFHVGVGAANARGDRAGTQSRAPSRRPAAQRNMRRQCAPWHPWVTTLAAHSYVGMRIRAAPASLACHRSTSAVT